MTRERQGVLVGVGLTIAFVAAFVLSHVLATIIIGIAASYMLLPVHRGLIARGLPAYWSAITTTFLGSIVSLALVAPFGFVLYIRRQTVINVLTSLDGSYPVTLGSQQFVIDLTPLQEAITPNISRLAVFLGRELSVLAAKFVVYAFIVFALLYYHGRLRSLVFDPIPASYHGIVERVHKRVRGVLFGHYVLVIVGGVTTYVAGLGVFIFLGYSVPYALALLGAVLWVLPFISAAPLVLVLAIVHVLSGEFLMAITVAALGAVFLVAVPRISVEVARRKLGESERLSQALYFVGFVGGGLTVGLVGFIAGPLALTILTTLFREIGPASPGTTLEDGSV